MKVSQECYGLMNDTKDDVLMLLLVLLEKEKYRQAKVLSPLEKVDERDDNTSHITMLKCEKAATK